MRELKPVSDSKTAFEKWWKIGDHGWRTDERLAEYRLAQDAFLAGMNYACDKIEDGRAKQDRKAAVA